MYPYPSQATITKDQKISDTQTSAVIYLPTQKNATQSSRKSSEDDSKSKLSQLLAQLNKVEKTNVVHFTTNNNENKLENCNKNIKIKENNLKILQKTPQFIPRFKFVKKNDNRTPNTINSVKKIGLALPKNDMLRKKQQSIIVISETSETDIKESGKKKKMGDNLSEVSVLYSKKKINKSYKLF